MSGEVDTAHLVRLILCVYSGTSENDPLNKGHLSINGTLFLAQYISG